MEVMNQRPAYHQTELKEPLTEVLRKARAAPVMQEYAGPATLYAVRMRFNSETEKADLRSQADGAGLPLLEVALDALQKGTELLVTACKNIPPWGVPCAPETFQPVALAGILFPGIHDGWPRAVEKLCVLGALVAPRGLESRLERVISRRATSLNLGPGPSYIRNSEVLAVEASDEHMESAVNNILRFRAAASFLTCPPELAGIRVISATSVVVRH